MTHAKLRAAGLAMVAAVLIVDQLVKWWMLTDVFGLTPPIMAGMTAPPVRLTSFLNLALVWNDGISFGLFGGTEGAWILSTLAALVSCGLLVWLWRARGGMLVMALSLVIGGALGNVIDRLRFGAVADFLDLHLMGYNLFVFNVADAAISVGVVLIVIDSFLGGAPSARAAGETASGTNSVEADRE